MKNSESNVVSIIKEIAEEEGIECLSLSADWAFRLQRGREVRFIVGYQFPLNLSSAKEICQDKALTSEVLQHAGVSAAEHIFLPDNALRAYTASPDSMEVMKKELKRRGVLVIKDNAGTGGNQVYLVRSEAEGEAALNTVFALGSAAAMSPFYEIENEFRAVVLDKEVKIMIRKERMSVTGDGVKTVAELAGDDPEKAAFAAGLAAALLETVPAEGEKILLNWKHNLGQGAKGYIVEDPAVRQAVSEIALAAAEAVGIRFASVDVISVRGKLMVLEVNGGVMLEHFSGQSEENYRLAKAVYKEAIRKSFPA